MTSCLLYHRVGGEYPMTSTSAMEYKARGGAHAVNQRDDKLHRGRNVVLAFLMQGWGQLLNVSARYYQNIWTPPMADPFWSTKSFRYGSNIASRLGRPPIDIPWRFQTSIQRSHRPVDFPSKFANDRTHFSPSGSHNARTFPVDSFNSLSWDS